MNAAQRTLLTRRWALIVAIAATVTACDAATGPDTLYGPGPEAVPLDPIPAEYSAWWRQVEECAGKTDDLAKVNWYVYPDHDYVPGTRSTVARTWMDLNAVGLTRGVVNNALDVRHEMMHLLIDMPGHPPEYFQKCSTLTGDF